MVHTDQPYLIPGKLLDQQRILHEVELVIVTKQLLGQSGVEDEAISEIKLAQSSPVPDGGPYMLRYVFKGKQHEDKVRIKLGTLISA
jgi:hypothetical protein